LEHMAKVNLPHFQSSAIGKYIQSSIPVWKEKIRKGKTKTNMNKSIKKS